MLNIDARCIDLIDWTAIQLFQSHLLLLLKLTTIQEKWLNQTHFLESKFFFFYFILFFLFQAT